MQQIPKEKGDNEENRTNNMKTMQRSTKKEPKQQ